MDDYREQFFSSEEGAPRAAAKRLTRTIERELIEATINAPDWFVSVWYRLSRAYALHLGILFMPQEWHAILCGKGTSPST